MTSHSLNEASSSIVFSVDGSVRIQDCNPKLRDDERVEISVNIASLTLLALGLLGLATSNSSASATGLFLYALIGFGSAFLVVLGYCGWNLLVFGPPLGLAFVFVVGVLLATTGIWSIGLVLFWVVASVTASVHVTMLSRALKSVRLRQVSFLRVGSSERCKSVGPQELGRLLFRLPWPLTLVAGFTTALGFLLCIASALDIRNFDPGWSGLLGAISPAWYIGLLLIATGIIIGQRLGNFYAGLPVIALQLALTLTSAIAFSNPRYAWTVKQVGETSYILLHGSANAHLDIYQAWPGIFAGVAWLCRISAFTRPMGIARWWPPVIDLATLILFHQLASRVLRDHRRAWFASAIFVLGYAIADSDYFSPQGAAYFLAIAIFAVVFRHRDDNSGMSPASWILLFTMSIAVAITHQLSPYMVTGALIILVLFRRARTEWAPVITLTPALIWALLHYSYVAQYASISALGNILSNILTPGVSSGGPAPSTLAAVTRYFQGASPLLIGLIALAALVRDRSKLNVLIALCAASGGGLILGNSYGNEADFRVVLFALPWLAILASRFDPLSRLGSVLFRPIAVLLLLVGFLMADMGLDFIYAVRSGDLVAVQAFEDHAPVGSTLIMVGFLQNEPINATGRFNLVHEESFSNVLGSKKSGPFSAANSYGQFMTRLLKTRGFVPSQSNYYSPVYYVLFAQQSASGLAAYNYASLKQYQEFSMQFAKSSAWKLVLQTPTSELFRLLARPYGLN